MCNIPYSFLEVLWRFPVSLSGVEYAKNGLYICFLQKQLVRPFQHIGKVGKIHLLFRIAEPRHKAERLGLILHPGDFTARENTPEHLVKRLHSLRIVEYFGHIAFGRKRLAV